MRAIIDEQVFGAAHAGLELLTLLELGSDERHTILTRPVYNTGAPGPIAEWLQTLPSRMRRECERILGDAMEANPTLPASVSTIRVVDEPSSDWQTGRLTVSDAVRLLRTPLRLLLENRYSDYHFLLWLAPPTRRQELIDAVAQGWVDRLGGGTGEMKKHLEDLVTAPSADVASHVDRIRLWVMFDRDSHPADRSQPSKESDKLRELCENAGMQGSWPLAFYQLGRRTIENYLPIEVLRFWEERGSGAERTRRRRLIDALADLRKHDSAAHWQYNMKKGLVQDLSNATRVEIERQERGVRDDELDPLFRGLPEATRDALKHGFGDKIGELYQEAKTASRPGCEQWFQAEYDRGSHNPRTREQLLESLFARM